jgi:hypothetical protein
MKVKKLIEELKKIDGNKLVCLASDSEGNNFLEISRVIELKAIKGYCIFPTDRIIE